jgi:uncharacterized membrane protein YdjX (TVP38/TMEM64 family)
MPSDSLSQPFEVTPIKEKKSLLTQIKNQWKLLSFLILSFMFTIMLNVYPPAKLLLLNLSIEINALGWFGTLLLSFVTGCIAIPFGLPYLAFETINVLLNENFFVALVSSVLSKVIGCSIVYYIIRFHLRKKISEHSKETKFYKGVEKMLQKHPLKFSFIVRVTVLPFSIKNYSLAIPDCINYKIYITAMIMETIPKSCIDIYLLQRAHRIGDLVTKSTTMEKFITIFLVTMSILILVYIAYYSKRVIKEIDSEMDALHTETPLNKSEDKELTRHGQDRFEPVTIDMQNCYKI